MAAEPRFRLREPNSKSEQPITMVIRYKQIKVTISTGFTIHPDKWNFRDQKVRNVVEAKTKDEINSILSKFRDLGELSLSQLKAEQVAITKDKIKDKFSLLLEEANKSKEEEEEDNKINLFAFFDSFIEQAKVRVNPQTGEKLDATTIGKYINTKKRLEEFQSNYDHPIDFENVDMEFYHDLVEFLSEEKNYALNTVGKYIKTFKEILTDATEKGINTKLDFKNKKFKTLSEEVDAVYLDEEELETILNFDFNNNNRLDKARDIFLIGAWTGLRFSDFTRLKSSNMVNDSFLTIKQKKSNGKVVIPIHPNLNKIIKKYEGEFPEPISNQNLNDYIKEVCEKVGIVKKITISKTKGGVRVTEVIPKYKLIGTHTARRSFATNLYKSGFPSISIMKITGHRTEKSFLKYIKVSPEEHAELLKKHWEKQLQKAVV